MELEACEDAKSLGCWTQETSLKYNYRFPIEGYS